MTSNADYNKVVMEHFVNPKNMGELENPDGVGEAGNAKCGDIMRIGFKLKDGKIEDIRFKTFGCAAAIASTSMLTELAKGKTIEEAKKISMKDVADALGGLPSIKLHCGALATDALREAIKDYESKRLN